MTPERVPNKFFKGFLIALPLSFLLWAAIVITTYGMFEFVLWVMAR